MEPKTSNFNVQTSDKFEVINFKSLNFDVWCLNFKRPEGSV